MLVISRQFGQTVMIGDDLFVTVGRIGAGSACLKRRTERIRCHLNVITSG